MTKSVISSWILNSTSLIIWISYMYDLIVSKKKPTGLHRGVGWKLIILRIKKWVTEAGFEPAFTSKPYKPIIRGFEPPPCAHHCASVTPYYQFNMCVYQFRHSVSSSSFRAVRVNLFMRNHLNPRVSFHCHRMSTDTVPRISLRFTRSLVYCWGCAPCRTWTYDLNIMSVLL